MSPRNPYEFTREEYNALVRKIPHPVYSQRSDYEEIELVEDCTLYDLYRQPRQPVTDPAVTRTLPVRVLNADLTCPICLGITRKTEVVMECLHRFCGECIQRSLRAKRECPSCRMHIPSKRSLRPDKNFDDLIAKIYPNLDEFNEQEEKLIAELNKRHFSNNSMTDSTKKGVQNQQEIRRNGGKKKLSSDADGSPSSDSSSPNGHSDKRGASWANASAESNGNSPPDDDHVASDATARKRQRTQRNGSSSTTSSADSTPTDASNKQVDDKVNVRVLVHPEEVSDVPKLTRTLFRTGYQLKIRHLKKHLISLLKFHSIENMRIVLAADNCVKSGLTASEKNGAAIRKDLKYDQELEDYVTLHDIYEQYGMGTKWELLLYYHFSDKILNGVAQFIASGV